MTVEHVIHHAFVFGGVVAVVGECEGPVSAGPERKTLDQNTMQVFEHTNA